MKTGHDTVGFFDRLTKEKNHLPFREWLVAKGRISKGMRLTSYTPDYLIPLYNEFMKQQTTSNP